MWREGSCLTYWEDKGGLESFKEGYGFLCALSFFFLLSTHFYFLMFFSLLSLLFCTIFVFFLDIFLAFFFCSFYHLLGCFEGGSPLCIFLLGQWRHNAKQWVFQKCFKVYHLLVCMVLWEIVVVRDGSQEDYYIIIV